MTQALAGVSPTRVTTTNEMGLGTEAEDRGKRYRYVKAAAAVAAGDAVTHAVADADEPHAVTPTTAITQGVAGICETPIASGSFGWTTVHGKVAAAKATAATAAGASLGAGTVAGVLLTIAAGSAEAAHIGKGIIAVDAEAGGLAEVFIQ